MTTRTLYHGSPTKFDSFNNEYEARSGRQNGFGTYLTDSMTRAYAYSEHEDGYVYEVRANLQDSISGTERTLSPNDIQSIVQGITMRQIEEDGYPYLLSDFFENTTEEWSAINHGLTYDLANQLLGNASDIDIVNELHNLTGRSGDLVANELTKLGRTHVITKHDNGNGVIDQEIVVFDPANLRITDMSEAKYVDLSNDDDNLNYRVAARQKAVFEKNDFDLPYDFGHIPEELEDEFVLNYGGPLEEHEFLDEIQNYVGWYTKEPEFSDNPMPGPDLEDWFGWAMDSDVDAWLEEHTNENTQAEVERVSDQFNDELDTAREEATDEWRTTLPVVEESPDGLQIIPDSVVFETPGRKLFDETIKQFVESDGIEDIPVSQHERLVTDAEPDEDGYIGVRLWEDNMSKADDPVYSWNGEEGDITANGDPTKILKNNILEQYPETLGFYEQLAALNTTEHREKWVEFKNELTEKIDNGTWEPEDFLEIKEVFKVDPYSQAVLGDLAYDIADQAWNERDEIKENQIGWIAEDPDQLQSALAQVSDRMFKDGVDLDEIGNVSREYYGNDAMMVDVKAPTAELLTFRLNKQESIEANLVSEKKLVTPEITTQMDVLLTAKAAEIHDWLMDDNRSSEDNHLKLNDKVHVYASGTANEPFDTSTNAVAFMIQNPVQRYGFEHITESTNSSKQIRALLIKTNKYQDLSDMTVATKYLLQPMADMYGLDQAFVLDAGLNEVEHSLEIGREDQTPITVYNSNDFFAENNGIGLEQQIHPGQLADVIVSELENFDANKTFNNMASLYDEDQEPDMYGATFADYHPADEYLKELQEDQVFFENKANEISRDFGMPVLDIAAPQIDQEKDKSI
ncbi:MAG: hypothetical protein LBT37_05960 [Lactobacillaceae bacterium]|jgi:hypothetical protein|nr:hypothetical protein [Lactobacillaceae bacterium]